ncbi:unnamed protein product [Peniophora sp. CBMAI 1063]|nr:unnamed protein product [Peniophora sp. CBMAI 1063]
MTAFGLNLFPFGYVGFLEPQSPLITHPRLTNPRRLPYVYEPIELDRFDMIDILSTINLVGSESIASVAPVVARQLVHDNQRYLTTWDNSIRRADRLEVWDRIYPGYFPYCYTAQFTCLVRVSCAQNLAALALSYAVARIIDESVFMCDLLGVGESLFKPEAVGFAHFIQGTEHYALVLFDGTACRAFEDVVRSSPSAIAGSDLGELVRSQPSRLAAQFCGNDERYNEIIDMYNYLTAPLWPPRLDEYLDTSDSESED